MEEEFCFRCERKNSEVKLVDAIYDREMVKICEECSLSENLPIIRRPSSQQLKESEKPYSVRERMKRMAGMPFEQKHDEFKPAILTLDKLRKPKDYKAVLESRFQQAKIKNVPLNLIDNYNWHILMARKNRKISRKQLGDSIGETENTVRLIEEKFLPDDALRIIIKMEQYLGLKLRTDSAPNAPGSSSAISASSSVVTPKPAVVLKMDKEAAKNITIDDLRKMKKAREAMEAEDSENKLKKEINVSEFVWNASGKSEKQEEKPKELVDGEIEFEDS